MSRDPHLGRLVAAVVDGALAHDARDRALAHLARCDDCRAEVEAQRRLKERLAHLAAPEVPGSLAERLRHLPDVSTRTPVPPDLPPFRLQAGFRPPAPPPVPPSRRVLGVAASGVAVLTLGLGAVAALGAPDRPTTVVTPAVDSFTVEHSRSSVGVPGADAVVELVDVGTAPR